MAPEVSYSVPNSSAVHGPSLRLLMICLPISLFSKILIGLIIERLITIYLVLDVILTTLERDLDRYFQTHNCRAHSNITHD
jgi:hypothetical protein